MNNENEIYFGIVIWFSSKKGYGFIEWEMKGAKQEDLFIHFSDIDYQGFKTLQKGNKVQFKLGINRNNELKAVECLVLNK